MWDSPDTGLFNIRKSPRNPRPTCSVPARGALILWGFALKLWDFSSSTTGRFGRFPETFPAAERILTPTRHVFCLFCFLGWIYTDLFNCMPCNTQCLRSGADFHPDHTRTPGRGNAGKNEAKPLVRHLLKRRAGVVWCSVCAGGGGGFFCSGRNIHLLNKARKRTARHYPPRL